MTQPKLRFPNCHAKHDKIAATLQITGPAKRAEANAKAAATRAKKKNQRTLVDEVQTTRVSASAFAGGQQATSDDGEPAQAGGSALDRMEVDH